MTNLSGATTAVFIVKLSAALEVPVNVAWQTKDGTAKAGTDYEAASGSVTFEAGETQKQIQVVAYGREAGDTAIRKFSILLYPPENAILDQTLTEVEIQVTDSEGVAVTSLVVATGPRGLKGDPGLSAYELAKLQGFTGTLSDWINSQNPAAAMLTKTLRIPDATIPEMPPLADLEGKILAISGGKPIGVLPESGSAADVLIELGKPTGYQSVGGLDDNYTSKKNALSYYSNLSGVSEKAAALLLLLDYAASSGLECTIDEDVQLTQAISFDAATAVIRLRFEASINSDEQYLALSNLGRGSTIKNPCFKNITAPFVINRWGSNGKWISNPETILDSLTQTNDEVGYQPTASDSDVWASLPSSVQSQKICAGLIISDSLGVEIDTPTGRYMAITFNNCNDCRVVNPNFMGGKHQYGSILFNNTFSSLWGYGNCVIGGEVRYGSVSGAVFMRQKGYSGGIFSSFKAYRNGESGAKTYQNNINGRSARCYELTFERVTAIQCYYDGVDVFADYGTQSQRLDDYQVEEYPWNMLPTKHKVTDIKAIDCHGTGVTSDGQFNEYTNIFIDGAGSSGFYNNGIDNYLFNITVKNANSNYTRDHAEDGAQIRCINRNSIENVRIVTDPTVSPIGWALYCPLSGSSLKNINTDLTNLPSRPAHPASQNLYLGRASGTDTTCDVLANPQPTLMANPCGRLRYTLTYAISGSERGNVALQPVYAGVYVNGLRAVGDNGGTAILGVGIASNASFLGNGEMLPFESGGYLKFQHKNAAGFVKTYTLTADA